MLAVPINALAAQRAVAAPTRVVEEAAAVVPAVAAVWTRDSTELGSGRSRRMVVVGRDDVLRIVVRLRDRVKNDDAGAGRIML